MINMSLLDQILAETYTKTQVIKYLHLVRDFVNLKIFGSDQDTSAEALHNKFLAPQLSILQQFFNSDPLSIKRDYLLKIFPPDHFSGLFQKAEQAISQIEPLVIYSPIPLPETEVSLIGQSLRQSYGPHFLIDLKSDPSLIAGPALVWKGIYKDYSIRQKVKENRPMILKFLKEEIKG